MQLLSKAMRLVVQGVIARTHAIDASCSARRIVSPATPKPETLDDRCHINRSAPRRRFVFSLSFKYSATSWMVIISEDMMRVPNCLGRKYGKIAEPTTIKTEEPGGTDFMLRCTRWP